jgi:hypothetical protein
LLFSLPNNSRSYIVCMTKYLKQDEIKPGALIKVASYHTNKMIPAVIIRFEETGTGVEYARAVDAEGEWFLANPDYLEAWPLKDKR